MFNHIPSTNNFKLGNDDLILDKRTSKTNTWVLSAKNAKIDDKKI